MKVQLLTCSHSPQCLSTKMFLDLHGIVYDEVDISHDEMSEQGFNESDMPVMMVDDSIEMIGFDAVKLKQIFN